MENQLVGEIEGFYGEPWSMDARRKHAEFLKNKGFNLYINSPKDSPFLRERWVEDFPDDVFDELQDLGNVFHLEDINYGVGLSPLNIYNNWNNTNNFPPGYKCIFSVSNSTAVLIIP